MDLGDVASLDSSTHSGTKSPTMLTPERPAMAPQAGDPTGPEPTQAPEGTPQEEPTTADTTEAIAVQDTSAATDKTTPATEAHHQEPPLQLTLEPPKAQETSQQVSLELDQNANQSLARLLPPPEPVSTPTKDTRPREDTEEEVATPNPIEKKRNRTAENMDEDKPSPRRTPTPVSPAKVERQPNLFTPTPPATEPFILNMDLPPSAAVLEKIKKLHQLQGIASNEPELSRHMVAKARMLYGLAETIRPELLAPASNWSDQDLVATWMDYFKMDKVFAWDDQTKASFIKAAIQIMRTDPLKYFLPSDCCQLEDTRNLHMEQNHTTKVYATLHQVIASIKRILG
jgi:hypothetical protein